MAASGAVSPVKGNMFSSLSGTETLPKTIIWTFSVRLNMNIPCHWNPAIMQDKWKQAGMEAMISVNNSVSASLWCVLQYGIRNGSETSNTSWLLLLQNQRGELMRWNGRRNPSVAINKDEKEWTELNEAVQAYRAQHFKLQMCTVEHN